MLRRESSLPRLPGEPRLGLATALQLYAANKWHQFESVGILLRTPVSLDLMTIITSRKAIRELKQHMY